MLEQPSRILLNRFHPNKITFSLEMLHFVKGSFSTPWYKMGLREYYNAPLTLRAEKRTGRGTSDMKLSLRSETPLSHKNFDKVLKVGKNNTALFRLIAHQISYIPSEQLVLSTKEETVFGNQSI